MIIWFQVFLTNGNNLPMIIWFQVFLTNTNNLHTTLWFQAVLAKTKNLLNYSFKYFCQWSRRPGFNPRLSCTKDSKNST